MSIMGLLWQKSLSDVISWVGKKFQTDLKIIESWNHRMAWVGMDL